jgi:maltooligosyltrehalose trehalohydrolase
MLKVIAGAMFISPFNPLIFMGEEYNEPAPFLYFTSHTDETLAENVSKGRRREFPDFIGTDDFPEPQSAYVFKRSCLTFDMTGKRVQLFEFYKELITLKRNHPVWRKYDRSGILATEAGNKAILFSKRSGENNLTAVLNFDEADLELSLPELNNYNVLINSADKRWGGINDGSIPRNDNGLLTINAVSIVVFSDISSSSNV